jgi:hypothetical protein
VRRKGFARKRGWMCYGTLRWVDVRLTNTRLAKYPHYAQNPSMSEMPCLHQTVQSNNVSDAVTPVRFDRCEISVALSLLTVTDNAPKRL